MCCDQCLSLWHYAKKYLLRGERRMHRSAANLGEDTSEMMVKFMLTLVRHGETDYNKKGIIQGQMDIPLSDEGLMQADMLGKYLRDHKFTSIYASDLRRAYQTAEAVVKHSTSQSQPAIIPDTRLRERNFGVLEGKPSLKLKEFRREAEQNRLAEQSQGNHGNRSHSPTSFTPQGAETVSEVKSRAILFFQDLCKQLVNSVELKSPTGSCTSESSLGVDICTTPDSVGPSGHSHTCTDGSQTDSGYPSPEGSSYEYNPEKAFASSLDVKSKQDGAKKSPTSSQRFKDAILGGRKTPTKQQQQGKGKDSDQAMVLAKDLEARTRIEDDSKESQQTCSNILVVGHGAWIRELIRHFVEDLQCNIPGGKHAANRMSYNTGMCKFEVDLSNVSNELRPHMNCIYMHRKEHLQEVHVQLRESP